MTTFQGFLIYYNNLDVKPFVEALRKFRKFYQQKDLDVFKISISIPGIARKLLFRAAKASGAIFPLFPKEDRDLHALVKKNICGGPSIIFNRYHKADATRIRSDDGKLCKRIIGLDANAIYLFSLAKKMPQGLYSRLDNFVSHKQASAKSKYVCVDGILGMEEGRKEVFP